MEKDELIIVFVKNIELGKVKTRLAKSVGDDAAFDIYKFLVDKTEEVTRKLTIPLHIYFSDSIIASRWEGSQKFIQEGEDLGARMASAFQHAFSLGYKRVVGIGTDLPDINPELIEKGIRAIQFADVVFGPANDGGYYLIGMNQLFPSIFENKPWSTEQLLTVTLAELERNHLSYMLLEELNDIDTLDDLIQSSIAPNFKHLL